MVAFFKRPVAEDTLDARIAGLSRRAQPPAATPIPAAAPNIVPAQRRAIDTTPSSEIEPASPPDSTPTVQPALPASLSAPQIVSEEDRFLLAREELLARLTTE